MRDLSGNYVEELDTYEEDLTPPEQVDEEDSIGTCDICGTEYYDGGGADWLPYQCCEWCVDEDYFEDEEDED